MSWLQWLCRNEKPEASRTLPSMLILTAPCLNPTPAGPSGLVWGILLVHNRWSFLKLEATIIIFYSPWNVPGVKRAMKSGGIPFALKPGFSFSFSVELCWVTSQSGPLSPHQDWDFTRWPLLNISWQYCPFRTSRNKAGLCAWGTGFQKVKLAGVLPGSGVSGSSVFILHLHMWEPPFILLKVDFSPHSPWFLSSELGMLVCEGPAPRSW